VALVSLVLATTACSGSIGGAGGGGSLGGGFAGSGRSSHSGSESASGADGFGKINPPSWDASSASSDGSGSSDGLGTSTGSGSSSGSSSGATASSSSTGSGSSSGSSSSGSGSSASSSSGGTAEAITGAGNNKVFVLGDSVLLAAETMLPTQLPGWDVTVDAKVSRRIDAGITELQSRRSEVGAVVVVHLCTNYAKGEGFAGKLDTLMGMLDGVKRVVLVTCVEWSDGQPEANAVIAAAPQKWSNVRVADWAKVARTSGYTGSDGIHLLPPGVAAISKLIADQIGPAPALSRPSITVPTIPAIGTGTTDDTTNDAATTDGLG
jgi:hypothetical protein